MKIIALGVLTGLALTMSTGAWANKFSANVHNDTSEYDLVDGQILNRSNVSHVDIENKTINSGDTGKVTWSYGEAGKNAHLKIQWTIEGTDDVVTGEWEQKTSASCNLSSPSYIENNHNDCSDTNMSWKYSDK